MVKIWPGNGGKWLVIVKKNWGEHAPGPLDCLGTNMGLAMALYVLLMYFYICTCDPVTSYSFLFIHNVFSRWDWLIFILFYTWRKLHTTSMCVNERTSSCNYFTRSEVSNTFNQVAAVVNRVCRPTHSSSSVTSCMMDGEMAQCDVESALICMVPIQALMMHPNSTLQQVCG